MLLNLLLFNAFNYLDKKTVEHENIFNDYDRYSFKISKNDMGKNKMFFYKNNKKIIIADFDYMGYFNKKTRLWAWSWGRFDFPKPLTYVSRKLLNYGLDINVEKVTLKSNHEFQIDLKQALKILLVNSRLIINTEIGYEILKALIIYITKSKYLFVMKLSKDEEQLLILNKIKIL